MAETARPLPIPIEEPNKSPEERTEDLRRLAEIINDTHTDELIISLCGFIGTDIHLVSKRLEHILENKFDYPTEIIFLSDQIKDRYDGTKGMTKENTPYYDYTRKLIDGGNALREKYENAILAQLAVQKIAYDRLKEKGEGAAYKPRRRCYIIDSVKNDKELELLRVVYRDIHYAIGVFSSMDMRRRRLNNEKHLKEAEIDILIERDSNEDMPFGQKVRDTFSQSDFFLRLDSYSTDELDSRLERFLHLIFSTKVITPTVEETAMYQASSAAGNSACLSRQVGAALTDAAGEVLSIGWNDVPRADGGLYTTELSDPLGKNDNRCFNIGTGCWNDKEKNQIAQELVDALIDEKLISGSMRSEAFQKIRKSKIKELVEFSRAVHAEMHAIIAGCLHAGSKVRGGMLFVTTYPCHNCARHIIVAGIKKVYYIEPYTKSLTTKLHADAITEGEKAEGKVMILMYDGIAPSRYLQLFKMYNNRRKEDNGSGKPIEPDLKTARPKTTLSLEAIPVLEMTVAEQLRRKGLEIKL